MPLRRLSQAVIHAIAAGEVIERPAVVIKELIENSLDAGATNIEIWLGPDPRTSFRVHDNGTGIAESDFSLLAQPHTTSKIENVDDLQKIHSFGFRGEALASLVAVADVKIQTKTANQDHGFELHFQFGEHSTPVKIGMNTGTTITVEKLFDQLPARKKFLVKPASELKKIVEVVTASALAHPEVSFSLLHQKKELLKTSAAPKWQDRIQQLFGNTVTDQGQWLDENRDIVKVKGFLGHPQTARKTAQQHIFINRRPIQLPQLNQLVKEL